MASQFHITANFDKRPRLQSKNNTDVTDALKEELDHLKDQLIVQRRQIITGSTSQASSIIQGAASGSASSSQAASVAATITALQQTLTQNIWNTITFSAPSKIIGFPQVWGIVRGANMQIQFDYDLSLMPASIKIKPSTATNIVMYMSYQNL